MTPEAESALYLHLTAMSQQNTALAQQVNDLSQQVARLWDIIIELHKRAGMVEFRIGLGEHLAAGQRAN